MQWQRLVLRACLTAVVVAGACVPRPPQERASLSPFKPETVRESVYRFPLPADPPTLDPAHVTDTVSDSVMKRLFDGLVRFDTELKIAPSIAESWIVSEDGLTYKFFLRKDVEFHNGRVVVSDDFLYSFTRILDAATRSERAQMLFLVKGAREFYEGKVKQVAGLEAPDEHTFKITLAKPYAPFLGVLAMTNFCVVPREEVEKDAEGFAQHPVGTGAFVFSSWDRDNQVVLKANRKYFRGSPKIDVLVFKITPDENTRYQMFMNGDLEHTDIPFGKMAEIMRDPTRAAMVHGVTAMDMYCYGFQTQKAPFDNKFLRLAFNYAVDKESVIKNILESRGEWQKTYVPPGSFYFKQDSAGYPYDPEKARKYLARAGYPGGKGLAEVTLNIDQQQLSRQIAQQVQEDLRQIGVKVRLEQTDWATFLDRVYAGEPSFFQNTWLADYPDPDNWLYVLLESTQAGAQGNITRFAHSKFDHYVRLARQTVDENERAYLYGKAEDVALAAAPWLLLYWRKNLTLVQPYVKGLTITAMDRTPQLNNTPMDKVYFVSGKAPD